MIDGIEATKMDVHDLRSRMAIIPQVSCVSCVVYCVEAAVCLSHQMYAALQSCLSVYVLFVASGSCVIHWHCANES